MGKLSRRELLEGQYFVTNRDVKGLVKWAKSLRIVTLDVAQVERTFTKEFDKPLLDEAFRIFRGYFFRVDREVEYRRWRGAMVQASIYSMSFLIGLLWLLFKIKG